MNASIYIEGGESKGDKSRCREGFRKLIEKSGFKGRMPRLIASGSRGSAYSDFQTEHSRSRADTYVAMLIDSEDALSDVDQTWNHLKVRDGWEKPAGAIDEQVLFMTTCMETWIVADRETLREHYGQDLQESALPPQANLETRNRHDVQDNLQHATRNCSNSYQKGKRSFELIRKLNPQTLRERLPSFARFVRILEEKLS